MEQNKALRLKYLSVFSYFMAGSCLAPWVVFGATGNKDYGWITFGVSFVPPIAVGLYKCLRSCHASPPSKDSQSASETTALVGVTIGEAREDNGLDNGPKRV